LPVTSPVKLPESPTTYFQSETAGTLEDKATADVQASVEKVETSEIFFKENNE